MSLTWAEARRSLAQRFTLQMPMALFSEDIGLLDKYLVMRVLGLGDPPLLSGPMQWARHPTETGSKFNGHAEVNDADVGGCGLSRSKDGRRPSIWTWR